MKAFEGVDSVDGCLRIRRMSVKIEQEAKPYTDEIYTDAIGNLVVLKGEWRKGFQRKDHVCSAYG